MFLIDKTNVGSAVLYCAPKTGCTSLTEIANLNGIHHVDSDRWHVFDRAFISGRTVAITVRDPRQRLLSLWRHYCNEIKETNLEDFIAMQDSIGPFFKLQLCDWYKSLLGVRLELIHMECFHEDIFRILGWTQRIHINKTNHLHWRDYKEAVMAHKSWWRDDALAFGYELC